jgi:hypothetical protein
VVPDRDQPEEAVVEPRGAIDVDVSPELQPSVDQTVDIGVTAQPGDESMPNAIHHTRQINA